MRDATSRPGPGDEADRGRSETPYGGGGRPPAQMLVAVLNREEWLEEILAGFLELGITGATVLNTEGMGRLLSHEIPIFAGLQTLTSRSRPRNYTLFSVIDDPRKLEEAMALLREVCGDLGRPATGLAFTVPVTRVVGLAQELDRTSGE